MSVDGTAAQSLAERAGIRHLPRAGLGTVVPESTERIHGHQTHSLRTDPRTTDHGELEGEERSPFTDHGPRTTV